MQQRNPDEQILSRIASEINHLDNMMHRLGKLSSRLVHQSYIERITLRIDYTRRAYKELADRIRYEKVVEDIRREAGERPEKETITPAARKRKQGGTKK